MVFGGRFSGKWRDILFLFNLREIMVTRGKFDIIYVLDLLLQGYIIQKREKKPSATEDDQDSELLM